MSLTLMEASGGLGGSKLALADATEAEVLAGKKFYAGDKEIKTGTMTNNGAVDLQVSPGGSVTVPEGYHNGNGKVTAGNKTLKSNATVSVSGSGQMSAITDYYRGHLSLSYSITSDNVIVVTATMSFSDATGDWGSYTGKRKTATCTITLK